MDYEEARGLRSVGFTYEVPVPLPDLGHRFATRFEVEGQQAVLAVVQVPQDEPVGGITMSGPGLRDHGRDRFGVFSRSQVELRFPGGPPVVEELGLVATMAAVKMPDGQMGGIIGPTDEGREFCTLVVNNLVDAYTRAHGTYWLANVTPDDIMSLRLVDWDDPAAPKVMSMMLGTGTTHTIRFGRAEGYPATTPDRLFSELGRQPSLAEDLLLSARRDMATRRHRSALASGCLAFEVFVRGLLAANAGRVPDQHFRRRTLKELCQKKGCLPAVIGSPLNNGLHGSRAESYTRIAALRDHLLHQGSPAYDINGERVEVADDNAVQHHLDLVVDLAGYLNRTVVDGGGVPVRFG